MRILLSLLLLLCANMAYAEEATDSIELKRNKSIDLRFNLYEHYDVPLLDYWNEYANRPRDIIIIKYRGLHSIIHKQLYRVIKKYYERQLRQYWTNIYDDELERDAVIKQYYLEESDCEYRWWDRTWMQAFLPEKGGARVTTHTIGHSHEFIRLGPISIKNTGRISFKGWKFTLTREKERKNEKRHHLNLRPEDKETPVDDVRSKERDFIFRISPPKGNIYTGQNWTLSGDIKFNVRFQKLKNNRSSIKGRLKLIGYYRRTAWITIQLIGKAKPFRDEYNLSFSIFILL